jgi:hypothetical protein
MERKIRSESRRIKKFGSELEWVTGQDVKAKGAFLNDTSTIKITSSC